jgi:hypothetical protein
MNIRTCFQMMNGVTSRLATVIVIMLLASACNPAPRTFRPPNQNELLAFAKEKGIMPVVDKLLTDSVVLLYEQSASFGYYTLTVRESDGVLVELQHVSAAKSDQPILIIGQLTGDEPVIAVVIQDLTLLAETTAIEVSIDAQNRLTATTNRQAGAILVSPSPVIGWKTITLYNAQGETLYSQAGQ